MTFPCGDYRLVSWSGRWYWLGAVTLAAAMVTLGAGARLLVADSPPGSGSEDALPADLAWLPADTAGFLSLRVGDLWQSPSAKAARAQLAKDDPDFAEDLEKGLPQAFEQLTGVAPPEVERLTLALPAPFPKSLLEFPLSITTTKPFDRDKVVRTVDGGTAERQRGDVVYYQGRERGVVLRFLSDRTFLLSMPPDTSLAAPPQGDKPALTEMLRLAADKHSVVGGLIPIALLEQIEEAGFSKGPPVLSFLLATNPLFLARSAAVTLDVGETSRLGLRLLYRKETTAATGEDALRATFQVLGRWLRRQLATVEEASGGTLDMRVLRPLVTTLQDVAVEQQGKVVQASLQVKGDLTTAWIQAIAQTRQTSRRLQSQLNLKRLGLAIHNYHDVYGRFLPAIVTSKKDGKPLYSWRVLVLPFLEADNVYRQFKLDEPWDSPNNKRLLALMPKIFAAPGVKKDQPYTTHYQVLVGGRAMFEPNQGTSLAMVTDGLSNTMMIVEAQEAVPWTKPADLSYMPQGPLPKFGGLFRAGFHVVAGDDAVHFIPHSTDTSTLRALITRSGGEVVSFPDKPSMGRNTTYRPPTRGVEKKPLPPPKIIEQKK